MCDQTQCYRLYSTAKNFDTARKQCALDGGDLVVYTTLGQQLLVENYFKAFTLPGGYWVGTSRPSLGGAWSNVDGSPLPQNASYDPYAHFTWLYASHVSSAQAAPSGGAALPAFPGPRPAPRPARYQLAPAAPEPPGAPPPLRRRTSCTPTTTASTPPGRTPTACSWPTARSAPSWRTRRST